MKRKRRKKRPPISPGIGRVESVLRQQADMFKSLVESLRIVTEQLRIREAVSPAFARLAESHGITREHGAKKD
jgi:hypothetical protein